jgi:hypothetical protein
MRSIEPEGDQSMGYSDMRTLAISLISSACVLTGLAWPQMSEAQAVPLVFQTTFNCPEWRQSDGIGEAVVCNSGDGISGSGGWTTSNGSQDQITAAANYSGGGGGRGFRHWVGDGLNNAGGGIQVSWISVSEIWFRYYIRFQSGFRWGSGVSPNMKTIYCNYAEPGTFYFGLHEGVIGGHVEADPSGGNGNHHSNVSWAQWQGGSTGDGNFHVLEVHAKMNTTGSSPDGIFEFWLNGNLLYRSSTVHFSNATGTRFNNCKVGENHNNPQNGGVDVYVDFDDIAVSNVGYIGPLGPTVLPAPRNLRVQ